MISRLAEGIADRIANLNLDGFGGGCYEAAKHINKHVFRGRGKIVGVANKFWHKRGKFYGHVAVQYGGKYWDADAQPKDFEDIESWGMLDPEDSDYHAPGWDDTAAEEVIKLNHAAVDKHWR